MPKEKGAGRSKVNKWGCTQNGVKRYASGGGLARANQLSHSAVDRLLTRTYKRCLKHAVTKAVCAGQSSVPLQNVVEGAKVRCGLQVVGVRPKQARQQTRKAKESNENASEAS